MKRLHRTSIAIALAIALVFAYPVQRANALVLQVCVALVVVAVVGTGVYVAVKAGKKLQEHNDDRFTNYTSMNFEYNDCDGEGWEPLTNVWDRPDSFTLLVTAVPESDVEWPLLEPYGISDGPHTHVVQLPPADHRVFRVRP